ncbi:protein-L-isoaspartate(D-aspartate) O-methyltransferase [Kribbella sp. NBC_01245]|uniref:protein-L-isoaspartate(D-aspartate) O-methyltransferase n=1 Tax=Kribbella sp. NBC_01245 TaxID=2903578 RepID=UPI002E2B9E86|nr:protein-L-isoaspartate(D-aspartate) O-methyltransferase [Kribbella sp. NBC_01245]
MCPAPADREAERARLVDYMARRGIHDDAVLAAMQLVPRELFVPPELAEFAYRDTALPIEAGQTISQPYVVALMIQALELRTADRVLEIGTGSGYAAAVLGRVAGEVYTVERLAELAGMARERLAELGYDNIEVRHGDGHAGWPEHAPYDGIVVAAAAGEVPEQLRLQLAVGGRLVIPVGAAFAPHELLRIRRTRPDEFRVEKLGEVRFVPLLPGHTDTTD